MDLKRIRRGIGANFYDKLVVAAIQLASLPILTSYWGLDLFGVWVLLSTIPSFLSLGDFGLATAAATSMTMMAAQNKRTAVVHIFQSAWAGILGLTLIIAVVVLPVVWIFPNAEMPTSALLSAEEVSLALSLLVSYGIVCLQGGILTAAFRCSGYYALGMYCAANTILAENMCVVLAVASGVGPVGAAGALLGARVAGLIVQHQILKRRVPWLPVGLAFADWPTARSLFSPATAVMAIPFAQVCLIQGIAVALSVAASPSALPAFAAARTITRLGLQLPLLINHSLLPEFSAAAAKKDAKAMSHFLLFTLLSSAALTVPLSALIGFGGPWLLRVWSNGVISPAPSLMYLMAVAALFSGFWVPLSNLFLAMNRQALFSYTYLTVSLLAIPVSYFASASLGNTGAAIAIATAEGIMLIVILRLSKKFLPSPTKPSDGWSVIRQAPP